MDGEAVVTFADVALSNTRVTVVRQTTTVSGGTPAVADTVTANLPAILLDGTTGAPLEFLMNAPSEGATLILPLETDIRENDLIYDTRPDSAAANETKGRVFRVTSVMRHRGLLHHVTSLEVTLDETKGAEDAIKALS